MRHVRRVVLALALGIVVVVASCRATVVPPEGVEEPVAVFLLDHGRHASLVLPGEPEGIVRYSYGDWGWYALWQQGPGEASRAVLWPSASALGRRELDAPPTLAGVRQAVVVGTDETYRIEVEREAAARLRAELDLLFEESRDTLVVNERIDLELVRHPRSYHLFHDSNDVVADWLQRLGCEVRGRPFCSRWRIRPD